LGVSLLILPRRQALGLLLAVVLLFSGRMIRTHMLLDDQGLWRDRMWLDDLVLPDSALAGQNSKKPAKIVLTTPLPINSCSTDSLRLLPGVGKVMAQRIDEARQNGMVFKSAADLRSIKGIGEKLSARLDTLVLYLPEASNTPAEADSTLFGKTSELH